MPSIKSSALEYCLKLVLLILSLNKIMPSYSCYIKKWLVYIAIIALFSYQPSFYTKCT